jgi:hypothetical protein
VHAYKSEEKHELSQGGAEQVFFNTPLLVVQGLKHSEGERRLHALGKTNAERFLHITFTLGFEGRKVWVISARDMHRKEWRIYEEKAETHP